MAPGPPGGPGQGVQVGGLVLVEPQDAGNGIQDCLGGVAALALFETG